MKQAQNKDQEKQNWPIMRNPTRFPRFMGWLATFVLVTYIIYTLKLLSSPPSLSCYEDVSLSLSLLPDNVTKQPEEERVLARKNVTLDDVVFGIAGSANLWERRKDYIKLWWRKPEMRGVVWLDREVRTRPGENLPEVKVSGNVDKFRYTNRQGQKLAIRITRVVSETYRLGLKNVKWFVMGDDDTFFVTDNLLRVLSKYDHNEFYYIGSSSESHLQNIYFSYSMAFGGGGFAISYPLAKELEKMQDRCIQRYPGLFASDDRVQACMAELGVPLTKEVGFHQYDVIGNLFGLLAAHPVAPLVTMHHLDVVEPIFPNKTRLESLQKLTVPMKLDSASLIQQSICYDHKNKWTVSISWGYAIQIFRGILSPREIEMPSRTFLNWYKRADYTSYSFNTRPVSRNPCQKPFVFYLSRARMVRNETLSEYIHHRVHHPSCRWKMTSPDHLERVEVFKKPDPHIWDRHDDLREFYSVSEAKTYFLDLPELRGKMCMETKGWIVTASDKGEMALVHPLTHVEIQLPHQNTSKCYNKHPMEPLIFVQRAVLSSPPNPKNENDCVLMIVHGGVGDIGICRPGRDNVWTIVDKNILKCAINSLEYRDKFYVLSNLGEMWEYDVIGKSKDTVPVSPRKLKLNILKHLCCNQSYLVASEGSLLVVFWNGIECMDYGSTRFWVFEIDIDHEGYKEVTSLGSRAIFVGHSASLSIDTICHPELIPNSIYFTDDCFETYLSRPEGGGMNMGIYSLEDKSMRSHYSGKSLSRVCPPVWTFLTIK